MTIPRFPSVIIDPSYSYVPMRPRSVSRFAGNLNVQIAAHTAREMRSWVLPLRNLKETERSSIMQFFETNGSGAKFLFKDLKDKSRTGIALSALTTEGSVTRWGLPQTGLYGGDFPDDASGTYTVYVGGSPVTVSSVDTDNREFVLQTGVADTSVVTADYEHYRYCMLAEDPTWGHRFALQVWNSDLKLEEVGRDS